LELTTVRTYSIAIKNIILTYSLNLSHFTKVISTQDTIIPIMTTTILTIPLWLNGQEHLTEPTYTITSPHTNTPIWSSSLASPSLSLSAIQSSQAAFQSWSFTKPSYRRDILLKAAQILEERTQEYASYMCEEMGCEVGVSQFFVMPLAIQMLKDIAGRISGVCGSVPVCGMEGMSAMVWKEAYGVTLGIVPW
jgi:acyl-CoA reductase-like NAD-dependent aldehyde dehydrogenase